MSLLQVYDQYDGDIAKLAGARSGQYPLPVTGSDDLANSLDRLVAAGSKFDRVLFTTHGIPGSIYVGGDYISAAWWRGKMGRKWSRVTTVNAHVYFNGCNVAEGSDGWDFLDAAAAVFLNPGGGEVFAQTSVGVGLPWNGHSVHFWGKTRKLYVDYIGRVTERFEQ